MLINALAAPLIGLPGLPELIIIFAVALLLFGGAKLPQLARSLGQAMRNFRDETSKLKREVEVAAEEEEEKGQANNANAQSSSRSAQNQESSSST